MSVVIYSCVAEKKRKVSKSVQTYCLSRYYIFISPRKACHEVPTWAPASMTGALSPRLGSVLRWRSLVSPCLTAPVVLRHSDGRCGFPQFPLPALSADPRMCFTPASLRVVSTTSATIAIRLSSSKPPRWVNCRIHSRCLPIPRLRIPPLRARAVAKLKCLPLWIPQSLHTSVYRARRSSR